MNAREKTGRYPLKQVGRKCKYDNHKLKSLIKKGLPDQKIADIIGCSKQNVAYTRRKMGILYREGSGSITKLDYQKIEELYYQNKNDVEISEIVECSSASVCTWRHQNGLSNIGTRRTKNSNCEGAQCSNS